MFKILIAEDDVETSDYIARGLREMGHVVTTSGNGGEAIMLITTEPYDAIILDRMMPAIDGLTVLRSARAAKVSTPVLMLTALAQIEDRVDGLEAGADDYLVKPFAFTELLARINAITRRPGLVAAETVLVLRSGDIELDRLKREVRRGGRRIELQPREFLLLEELMGSSGRVITRTMLLERVWDFHFDPKTNIVETHISRLRSKLNAEGARDPIQTVRGSGYLFATDS